LLIVIELKVRKEFPTVYIDFIPKRLSDVIIQLRDSNGEVFTHIPPILIAVVVERYLNFSFFATEVGFHFLFLLTYIDIY
jgi:hypothetical protein